MPLTKQALVKPILFRYVLNMRCIHCLFIFHLKAYRMFGCHIPLESQPKNPLEVGIFFVWLYKFLGIL